MCYRLSDATLIPLQARVFETQWEAHCAMVSLHEPYWGSAVPDGGTPEYARFAANHHLVHYVLSASAIISTFTGSPFVLAAVGK
jgi:hypothetical protein